MNGNDLTPINTQYKGYNFRSRLEARYAVMFDALGWEWQYESEGYQLKPGWYLPDFYFPGLGLFAEVKARELNESELQKCIDLSKGNYDNPALYSNIKNCQVLLLEGQPECKPYRVLDNGKFLADAYLFGRQDKYFPLSARNSDPHQSLYLTTDAVNRAKSARFEHGETPGSAQITTPPPVISPVTQRADPAPYKPGTKFSLSDLKKRNQ